MEDKPLYIIVGPTASGKRTLGTNVHALYGYAAHPMMTIDVLRKDDIEKIRQIVHEGKYRVLPLSTRNPKETLLALRRIPDVQIVCLHARKEETVKRLLKTVDREKAEKIADNDSINYDPTTVWPWVHAVIDAEGKSPRDLATSLYAIIHNNDSLRNWQENNKNKTEKQ